MADYGTDPYWARQQVQERLVAAEVPSDVKPGMAPLSSVIGEIYRYTLHSATMPLVEVKAFQDWVLEREFLKVPGVAETLCTTAYWSLPIQRRRMMRPT